MQTAGDVAEAAGHSALAALLYAGDEAALFVRPSLADADMIDMEDEADFDTRAASPIGPLRSRSSPTSVRAFLGATNDVMTTPMPKKSSIVLATQFDFLRQAELAEGETDAYESVLRGTAGPGVTPLTAEALAT